MTGLLKRPAALLALIALLVVGACSTGAEDDSSSGAPSSQEVPDTGMSTDFAGGAREAAAPEQAGDQSSGDQVSGDQAPEARQPALISTGTVSLRSEDAAKARADAQLVVAQYRGSVTEEETITSDDGDVEMARLVLRVPSGQFDEVMKALEKTGELISSTSGSEDVTTQVIDTEVRIRAQRKSLERVEVLLARARNLQEIVAIEAQLTRRQADLDSLESQQAWLEDQTSQATITVHIEQAAEGTDTDGAGGFLGGLRDGWSGFVAMLGGLALALGFALPFLGLVLLLGVPPWVLLRNVRGRRPTTPADPVA